MPDLEARGIALVAVSVDALAASTKLATHLGLTFPLASDPAHTAVDAFGVFDAENEIAWPAMFAIDPDGTIAWRWLGDDYKIRIATADVVAALAALPATR
ncbi:MAG: peroxiredoxin family protein [Myxococcales bacterium]|nr:peroxiredoxin family protein [Myxococcales bacterium]